LYEYIQFLEVKHIERNKMSEEMMDESESVVISTDLESDNREDNTVAIVAIIATSVVLLCCILACTAIAFAFFYNAPW
jgi:hypothetical protein